MFQLNNKLKDMIPLYLLLVLSLFYFKPNVVFKPNGKPREYGLGNDSEGYKKTLFTLHFVILVIVFIIYFQYTNKN